MLYITEMIGKGTLDSDDGRTPGDPYQPPHQPPGWHLVRLVPKGLMHAGAFNLLWAPGPLRVDPRLTPLAASKEERLAVTSKTLLENRFSITLQNRESIGEMLREVFQDLGDSRDPNRWNPYAPSKRRGQLEFRLGGEVVYSERVARGPATQTFTESWPTNGTNFATGQDEAWTEQLNSGEVVANHLQNAALGANNNFRLSCDRALDTDDHFHQLEMEISSRDGSHRRINALARYQQTPSTEWYTMVARRWTGGAGDLRQLSCWDGSDTVLASDTTDPGAGPQDMEVRCDGSNISGYIGATTFGPVGDSTVTGNTLVAVILFNADTGDRTTVRSDTHVIEDVVSATSILPQMMAHAA